jgi:hypothetical protein
MLPAKVPHLPGNRQEQHGLYKLSISSLCVQLRSECGILEIMAAVVMLPDISLQQSEILGLEVGHDTSGHQGVVVRVEQEDHRQKEY